MYLYVKMDRGWRQLSTVIAGDSREVICRKFFEWLNGRMSESDETRLGHLKYKLTGETKRLYDQGNYVSALESFVAKTRLSENAIYMKQRHVFDWIDTTADEPPNSYQRKPLPLMLNVEAAALLSGGRRNYVMPLYGHSL